MQDGHTRLWLVRAGEQRPYYMMRRGVAAGAVWGLYSSRPVDRWPQLGELVAEFTSRRELERWVAASDLP